MKEGRTSNDGEKRCSAVSTSARVVKLLVRAAGFFLPVRRMRMLAAEHRAQQPLLRPHSTLPRISKAAHQAEREELQELIEDQSDGIRRARKTRIGEGDATISLQRSGQSAFKARQRQAPCFDDRAASDALAVAYIIQNS